MKKLIIALFLIALSFALPDAWAQLSYTTNNGAIIITGYNTNGGLNVIIPASINGYPVTAIGEGAFYATPITNVTIGTNVTLIYNYAFETCQSLKSIVIPTNVTTIYSPAFFQASALTNIGVTAGNPSYVSLGGVLYDKNVATLVECPNGLSGGLVMPNTVTNIGSYAFAGCEVLTSVTIDLNVISIGAQAFGQCYALTSIAIPNSVTNMGDAVFYGCDSLANVTIGSGETNIGADMFYYCTALTSLTIPNNIRSIGAYAFSESGLRSITIPSSVTNIGGSVFAEAFSLTNIAVDPANTFYASLGGVLYNEGLTTVLQCPEGLSGGYVIPNSVTNISDEAFQVCALTNVTIGTNVTSIGAGALQGCPIRGLTIPSSVTSIGSDALNCPYLTGIIVDPANNFYASMDGVLLNKSLTSVIQFPGGVAGSYTIPNGVTNIGALALFNSLLTSVSIPNSVTTIDSSALASCPYLRTVTLGTNVVSLGDRAFTDDTVLIELLFLGNAPTLGNTVFENEPTNATVYYVSGTTGWSNTYGGLKTMGITLPGISASPTSLTAPVGGSATFNVTAGGTAPLSYQWYFNGEPLFPGGNGTSYSLNNLTLDNSGNYYVVVINNFGSVTSSVATLSISLPFTFITNAGAITITGFNTNATLNVLVPPNINGYPVTTIAASAFNGLNTITNLNIPGNVTNIGIQAFQFCSGLASVTMNYGAVSIGDAAFYGCTSLAGIVIPNSVTYVGNSAFNGCTNLASLSLGSSVVTIGGNAFEGCNHLTSVTIPDSATSIGDFAFFQCTALTTAIVGNGVASIGVAAFGYAPLTSLTLGTNVATMGNQAFYGCSGLTKVLIPASVTNLGIGAFSACSQLQQAYFQGNAPLVDGTVGSADTSVFSGESGTAFYLTNAIGWGPTFGGWPTTGGSALAISSQPVSQTVPTGGNVTFSVTATGTATLGYQWWFDGGAISGATGTSYSLNGVKASNAGSYYVVVTNNFGSLPSSVATLTVGPPLDFQAFTTNASGEGLFFNNLARDSDGNLYISGYYQNAFTYGTFTAPTLSPGLSCFFLLKTDPAGNAMWLSTAQSTTVSSTIATAVTTDHNGGVYVGMSCVNTTSSAEVLIFGTTMFTINSSSSISVIAKYSQATGGFIWAKSDPSAASTITGLAVTSDNTALIATGDFQGGALFSGISLATQPSGARNTFLVRMSAGTGLTSWVTGAPNASGGYNRSGGLALDSSNNIYTTGYFGGTMFSGRTYQINANSTSVANPSAYVVKWSNPTGTVAIPQWAIGSTDSYDSGTIAYTPAADANGNIYVPFSTLRFPTSTTDTIGINITGRNGSVNFSQALGGEREAYVVSFDTSGNILWGEGTYGDPGTTQNNTKVVVSSNYVYVLGFYGGNNGNVVFDSTSPLSSVNGDSFLMQLVATNGALGWVRAMNTLTATPQLQGADFGVSTNDILDIVGTTESSPDNGFIEQLTLTNQVVVGPPVSVGASGSDLIINWPFVYQGFTLQTATDFINGPWTDVTQPTVQNGPSWNVVVPTTGTTAYFRLVK
jgi:hypothetical protein